MCQACEYLQHQLDEANASGVSELVAQAESKLNEHLDEHVGALEEFTNEYE